MEEVWSCYSGGQFNGRSMLRKCQFNGGRMVMSEVVSLMEEEWSCYRGGQYNGGSSHVMEVVSLMEGEWSCYRGGQFNGGRIVMLQR